MLSQILILYVFPLVWAGFRRPLTADDCYEQGPKDRVENVALKWDTAAARCGGADWEDLEDIGTQIELQVWHFLHNKSTPFIPGPGTRTPRQRTSRSAARVAYSA